MKIYLDIGPSTLRKFAYHPAFLNAGDIIMTLDPEVDLGTQGAIAQEQFDRRASIYPNSSTAEAAMQRRSLEIPPKVRSNNAHWQTTDYIYYKAMEQLHSNQRYERAASQATVTLIQSTGDGRDLPFPIDSIDEVVLQNVAGDKEIAEDDVLKLAEQACRVGRAIIFLETYTPDEAEPKLAYAAQALGFALNRRFISFQERDSVSDLNRFNFVHHWGAHGREVVLYEILK